jgi:gamma-glutamyltranspeptidase/glutathione hydrolase
MKSNTRNYFSFILLYIFSTFVYGGNLNQSAVVTAHQIATRTGLEILKKGGNAFDAAAAITASLAVVEPYGSGLGGGGFWLLHRSSDNKQVVLDGREMAPMRSRKDMYLDKDGNILSGLSLNGPMAAGIPGIVAGIDYLVTHYGQLSLQDILAPAIQQAKNGFIVTERYQKLIRYRKNIIQEYTGTASIFLKNNKIPKIGDFIVQNDLAKTLSMISENGSKGFYQGIFAQKMVNSVQKNGGIWETYDLEHYKIIEREPVTINYKGIQVTSVPPPSSGGVVLGQALNILEKFDLTQYDGVTRKHIIIEAMRRAYRDRAAYLGDSDFVDIPINRLLDKNYAEGLALTIDTNRATPSKELGTIAVTNSTGTNTTHFSVLDKYGNRVAATLSINLPFGSGFVVEGTGVLLNNEMDDFTIKPFTANTYGLVGYQANTIHPGKRPLSSMTPTFVESDDRIGILGTPGGSRIISMVLLAVLDFAEGELPESWVNLPRYHHQYIPDLVQYEKGGLSKDEKRKLILKGHKLKEIKRRYGNMQAIMLWKRRNINFVASDPRGEGTAEIINFYQ